MGRSRTTALGLGAVLHAGLLGAIARIDGTWSVADALVVLGLVLAGLLEHPLRGPSPSVDAPPFGYAFAHAATVASSLALPGEGWIGGTLLLAIGAALRARSIATLGVGYGDGIAPARDQLVCRGPYAHFRHPGELGALITASGVVVLTGSIPGFVALVALLTPVVVVRCRREDDALEQAFGATFSAYAERVAPRRAQRRAPAAARP